MSRWKTSAEIDWLDGYSAQALGLHVIGHDVDMAGLRFDIVGGSDSMLIHLT